MYMNHSNHIYVAKPQRWRESLLEREEADRLYALASEHHHTRMMRHTLWVLADSSHKHQVLVVASPPHRPADSCCCAHFSMSTDHI